MLDAKDKITKARLKLILDQPFWGNIIVSMPCIEVLDLPMPTMGTDGKSIYYDPKFVEDHTIEEIRGTLIHEILHCALGHLVRVKKFHNPQLWNQAADLSINWQIKEIPDVDLPDFAMLNDKYVDWTAEKIYADLEQTKQCNISGMSAQGNGDDSTGGMDTHFPATKEDQQDVIKKMVEVYDSLSQEEKEKGHVPGKIKELIDQMKNPPIDWKQFFRNDILDLFKKEDYTYEVLSSQYVDILEDVPMPRIAGKKNQTLAIFVDTSGSIGNEDLQTFSGVVDDICKLADEVVVVTCDYIVQNVYRVGQFSDIMKEVKFNGRGGTSFVPPFTKLAEMHVVPECCVYLTDGWGEFPKRPNYPVVWALTPRSAEDNYFPYGRIVRMDYEKK